MSVSRVKVDVRARLTTDMFESLSTTMESITDPIEQLVPKRRNRFTIPLLRFQAGMEEGV